MIINSGGGTNCTVVRSEVPS